MSYLKGWLGKPAATTAASLSREYELQSLQDASKTTALILEDKYEEASSILSKETSPFHHFMHALCYFQRAVLGTEPETIKAGLPIIAAAEQVIVAFHTRASQDPSLSHESKIYPAATVYLLMQAQVQMMYAVLAIMNASLSDALKALMKIRKAYATLQHIFKIEQDYAQEAAQLHRQTASSTSSNVDTSSKRSFEFQHAADAPDFADISSHPVDTFIHNGMCYSYGVLQWALSIVPAPFDKMLSFLSYRGDRKMGHSLIWEASKTPEDIHGALAGFTTLIIYNGISARCDIRVPDAVPYDKIEQILDNLKKLYPASHKWAVQQSIMLATHDRNLAKAAEVLQPGVDDEKALNFIRALCIWEQGCKYMYLHDFEASAKSFNELAKYTDWSYSLFHYLEGISYVEAYRNAKDQGKDDDVVSVLYTKANDALGQVMAENCKRKVLGKPVPIEVYLRTNMNRWLARAAAENCSMVEAVDVSPALEQMWLYGGYGCLAEEQLHASLHGLELYEPRTVEEQARKSLLRSACLRCLGQVEEAKMELERHVLCHNAATAKAWDRHAVNWILPAGHYDMAVSLWHEAQPDYTDVAKLKECAEHVRTASKWSGHDLQSIMGIQVSAALDALKKMGVDA